MDFPYFPFYPRDWMADPKVQLLDMREEWAYFKLLMLTWTYDGSCTLPNDDRVLSRLLRLSRDEWLEIREALIDGDQAVFQVDEEHDRIYNKRLMAEFERMTERSEAARNAAATRWERERIANGKPAQNKRNTAGMRTHSDRNADALPSQSERNAITEADTDTEPEAYKTPPQSPPPGRAELASSDPEKDPDPVREVWDHYQEAFNGVWPRGLSLTDGRRRKIRKRLERFSVGDLQEAITRIRASPWHIGQNPNNRVYATPEFLFRNDEQVETWMNYDPGGDGRDERVDGGSTQGGIGADSAISDYSDLYIDGSADAG